MRYLILISFFASFLIAESVRIATFNVSLYRSKAGELSEQMAEGNCEQINAVAAIIKNINPDIILLNEFDYDSSKKTAELFIKNYLNKPQKDLKPVNYEYFFTAAVNTGIDSGFDLNKNGITGESADCFGYGAYPGQYGMLLLSKYPINKTNARTFQKFLWKDMPKNLIPQDWFDKQQKDVLRLSSKSHWDVPIVIDGLILHMLCSHPTPPVFDGPEDLNGCRNHDEIRFWENYISEEAGDYIYDDKGVRGGLDEKEFFIIAGDLNNDPYDGDGRHRAIINLLKSPKTKNNLIPNSKGGIFSALTNYDKNKTHIANPAFDTALFNSPESPGNLRIDYLVASSNLTVRRAEVFWPMKQVDPYLAAATQTASDHRLVFIDVDIAR
jgi:3-phytase